MQFLVAGIREYGEPGVLVTFEESAGKVSANVASLGFDLDALQRDGLLVVHSFQVDPAEIVESGDFDFEPLFALLDDTSPTPTGCWSDCSSGRERARRRDQDRGTFTVTGTPRSGYAGGAG